MPRIGLFDSGLGGLSVLKTLWLESQGTHFIYFADLKNGPYGSLTKDDVVKLSVSAFELLLSKKSDAVVFACNTATSAAAQFLRETHAIPIFGMEPAVKPATEQNPGLPIAIFATELTLKEDKFKNLIEQVGLQNSFLPVPCEGLAKLIDSGKWDAAWHFLKTRIDSVISKTNIIVLGCTHYVFLKDRITQNYPNVKVYDGNLGTSLHIKNKVNLPETGNNSLDIILNTENPEYVKLTESIVSTFTNSFTISLNQ